MYATFRKCQGSGVYIIYALQQVEHSIYMLYGVFPHFSVSQKRTQAVCVLLQKDEEEEEEVV